MGNKCCKNQSSTYSSANATIRSFSSYNSSIVRRQPNREQRSSIIIVEVGPSS
ncbi:titin isoform X4 [Aphis craccivora]|uniref:Titin isoform X4 n=1 Tax=Aphis craccivora TaxID=307492 RepID=A0A6G0YLW0_APHCR|nr:titin isoform X4 [Aphis craccivora]